MVGSRSAEVGACICFGHVMAGTDPEPDNCVDPNEGQHGLRGMEPLA